MTSLHDYQIAARDWISRRYFVDEKPGVALAADCGTGKTLIVLDLIRTLDDLGECSRVLILAPLQVVQNVWRQEMEKHGYDFSTALCQGPNGSRGRALQSEAQVYLLNYENLQWLENQDFRPFDLLVLDESTRIKTWGGKRNLALKRMLRAGKFRRRICLSGTPAPRSLGDLHSQYYALDGGETLGRTVGWFRQRYMGQGGYQGREWFFRASETQTLLEAIKPITFRIDAEDYLDMPDVLYHDIEVDMPAEAMRQYRTLERALFLELESGQTLTASGAGAKYGACKQVANGGLYEPPEDGGLPGPMISHDLHTAKLEAVESIVEESAGKPVMVVYQFNGDRDRLLGRRMFRDAKVICGGMRPVEVQEHIAAWNAKDLPILLVQPQACSHGVNLQHGGNDIIWMGLTDQMEVYQQMNARIARQGVEGQVRIHHILCRDTVDWVMLRRLERKGRTQKTLLDALNQYRLEQQQQTPAE